MHEGHRRRMYEKIKNDSSVCDHELLEILLFNAYPRKNTNPVAHALLEAFGSLAGVFAADPEQLMTVDGVGENIALYIKCMGECVNRIRELNSGIAVLKNYEDFKNFTVIRMRGRQEEVLEFYCIEKNGKVKRIFSYTDSERDKVELQTDKIAYVIASAKPYGLLVAHNHFSGRSDPSINDDRFTAELQVMCSMNNVVLYDHCIYASDSDVYSFFESGKIDKIRKNFSFKTIIDRQIKMGEEDAASDGKCEKGKH